MRSPTHSILMKPAGLQNTSEILEDERDWVPILHMSIAPNESAPEIA